jgi:hypothetical protein
MILSAVVVLAACGGQDTNEPCVLKLNVFEMPQVQVGVSVPVDLELSVKSGSCSVPTNANVIWSTSNANIAEIESMTNTTATVRAKKQGSAFITAWLALAPSTRDSITLTVAAPVDQQP